MRTYSTAELARFIENYVIGHLTEIRKEISGTTTSSPFGSIGARVFDLYSYLESQPYGGQITAGFVLKILSDLRKAGLIVMMNGGKDVYLSEAAWELYAKKQAKATNTAMDGGK
jgi:hypothetical protein